MKRLKSDKGKATSSAQALRPAGGRLLSLLLVIAVVVLANVLMNLIPTEYTEFDVSNTRLYTLSEQTLSVLDALQEDVTLYFLTDEDSPNHTISELLKKYNSANPHVTLQVVDAATNPGFAAAYTDTSLTDNSVIVEGRKRFDVVPYEEIFVYDYGEYMTTGQYSLAFDGEQQITSAIDFVAGDVLPVLYVLGGHGEPQLPQALAAQIAADNIEARPLSLVSESTVPADAACILMNAPLSDLNVEEAIAVLAYLEGGGNMLLLTNPAATAYPNLDALMQSYGVSRGGDLIVEEDARYFASGNPARLLSDIGAHDVTAPTVQNGQRILMADAHAIGKGASSRFGLTTTDLLVTSAAARMEGTDLTGPFSLGVVLTETNRDIVTNIVWFGSGRLLDESLNELVSGANYNLFLNALDWLCERETQISIRPRGFNAERLVLSDAQVYGNSIVLVVVLPLLVLAAGCVIYYRRRKKH